MKYKRNLLKKEFVINHIVTMHYYEFSKDFFFGGEKHDFWELLYVDEGVVEVTAGENNFTLKQGDIIFHKPDEFHGVWANRKIAPNAVVICFDCKSPSMKHFENMLTNLDNEERNIIAAIIREGINSYQQPLGDPEKNILKRKKDNQFGSEQLIGTFLEILLINIIRKREQLPHIYKNKLTSIERENAGNDLGSRMISFMERNVTSNISLQDICRFFNVGRTQLAESFKRKTGYGVIEYLLRLKIDKAKKLIREGEFNVTGVAAILGYTSVHYFSRYFKKAVGCSPKEYGRTIKVRITSD